MTLLLNFIYPPTSGLLDTSGQTLPTLGTLVRRQAKGE